MTGSPGGALQMAAGKQGENSQGNHIDDVVVINMKLAIQR